MKKTNIPKNIFNIKVLILTLMLMFFYESTLASDIHLMQNSNTDTGISFSLKNYIYNESSNGISIDLSNNNDINYLIETSIFENDNQKNNPSNLGNKVPFIILPPLYKLAPNSAFSWRIKRSSNEYKNQKLPEDRETLFWIALRAIPEEKERKYSDDKKETSLVVTPTFFFKLIYRPKSIEELSVRKVEFDKKIVIKREGSSILLTNNSPLYITFSKFLVGETPLYFEKGRPIFLPPFSQENLVIPPNVSGDIYWQLSDENMLDLKIHRLEGNI